MESAGLFVRTNGGSRPSPTPCRAGNKAAARTRPPSQADGRLGASRRSLHGIGDQFTDQQFAVFRQARSISTPAARAWHAAGRRAPRSAVRQVRGNCAAEVPVRRDGKQGRRRNWARDQWRWALILGQRRPCGPRKRSSAATPSDSIHAQVWRSGGGPARRRRNGRRTGPAITRGLLTLV